MDAKRKDNTDDNTPKQTKKRKAAITTISTPPSTTADNTFQFNGSLNNLDNFNSGNVQNETTTILQNAIDSSGLLTATQVNNNQPLTNHLGQAVHVDKKEFVDYQNLTNRNINRMIEFLYKVGDDHRKNSDTIELLQQKVKELETELSSTKAKLNIANSNRRSTKSELINNKPNNDKPNSNKKKPANANTEASTPSTASKSTGNKKSTNASTPNATVTTINGAPENCKVINTVTTVSSLVNVPSGSNGLGGVNDRDANNNTFHYRNLKDSGQIKLHPTSKYMVESEHLKKCSKSQTYTAFVCRILTSLVSVEETFMRTCKGGHSIGINGLKKQSFSDACYQEILKAVEFYFPSQICYLDNKSWTSQVSRSINTKLFQMNKHYQFLMGYPINEKYKLNETDIKFLRNYDNYLKNPRLFENLLIEMYGKDALNKPENMDNEASLDDTYNMEDHEYHTIENQLNREQMNQLVQISQANVNQAGNHANLVQVSHANSVRVNDNQMNQLNQMSQMNRGLVNIHQLNENQMNQVNINQLSAANLMTGQETVEIDYNYFNLLQLL